MPYNFLIHQRRSIRLPGFDYSQAGLYFITICTHERKCLFGKVVNNKMILDNLGMIVENELLNLPNKYPNIKIGKFVIMPNHFHGIIHVRRGGVPPPVRINNVQRTGGGTPPVRRVLLGNIIAYFKYQSAKRINRLRNTPAQPVWQRNFYEHIIRDDDDYLRIIDYIEINPEKWEFDQNYK